MRKYFNIDNMYRKRWILIALLLFWILFFFIEQPLSKDMNYKSISCGAQKGGTAALQKQDELNFSITAKHDGLSSIGCYILKVEDGSDLSFVLTNESGQIISKQSVKAEELKDSTYYLLEFEPIAHSQGQTYKMSVTGEGSTDHGYELFLQTKGEGNDAGHVYEWNHTPSEYGIRYEAGYEIPGYATVLLWLYLAVMMATMILVLILDDNLEKNFIKIAVFGAIMVVVNPFPHPVDESTHFFRVFATACGHPQDQMINQLVGATVSSNYGTFIENQLDLKHLIYDFDLWKKPFSRDGLFYANKYMSSYLPINHLPAIVGVGIGKLLSLPAFLVIFLGRAVDYIAYVLIAQYAIKISKYYKSIFFMLALYPMTLFLASSITADTLLNATAMLLIAIILSYRLDESRIKLTRLDIALLLLCVVSIASVKYMIYCPLLLLFFFLPKEKFASSRSRRRILAIALVFVAVMAVWQVLLLKTFPYVEDRNGDVSMIRQVKFLLGDIPDGMRIMLNFMLNKLPFFPGGFTYYQSNEMIRELVFLATVFGSMFAVDKYQYSKPVEKKRLFWYFAIVILLIAGLTSCSLYGGFTPVGADTVDGVQPRYFIPVMLPLCIILSGVSIENHIKHYQNWISYVMLLGVLNMVLGMLAI